ncbi:hypothetical protein PIN31115_00283 [Pandoraea iniqua]|uniref:Type I restriction modification DNA specificity domain-containing protein n=1 Tax=Pandoraea iniqua TaxID=2508288 RepID=A0A5E4RPC8_9BURK|nr:restriction endonuclease subunit S [Pandoraea iniqua]VVD64875.1 hypothetical protein PIN31115_00283 [Pandoraea iniqua]
MSTVGKPGYKETAIGWIPTDWSVERVGKLAEVDSESLSNKTAADFSFRYISLGDVNSGKLVTGCAHITFSEAPSRARRIVKTGDILFATVRPNLKGHYFARWADGNVIASTGFSVVRARAGEASPAFLYQALLSEGVDGQIEKLTVGSSYPAVNSADVKGLLLPAPPLAEQQEVAAILTAVDDKLDVIARQIETTQTLKRGLMQILFSRGVGTQDAEGRWVPHVEFKDSELGEIPVGWEVKPLAVMSQESRARNAGILDDALLCGVLKDQGLIPMRERVKGATTERCRIVESNAFAYNPMRINIGSIARNLRDHSVMVSPDYVVFSTKAGELMYSYLDHFRRSDEWQRFVGRSGDGGVRIRIYYDDLAQLRMRVPPLKEQARIVEVLDCVSEKLNNLTTKQREFQTLKRGLMQKLLTGEWRVKLEGAEPLAA